MTTHVLKNFCYIGTYQPSQRFSEPFILHEHTYATDGVAIIRVPGALENSTKAENPDDAVRWSGIMSKFDYFAGSDALLSNVIPLSTLKLEPIIKTELHRDGDAITEGNMPEMPWLAHQCWISHLTPIAIDAREFDARRLLFIRQHFPDARYIAEPSANFAEPLHFFFGDTGQGLLMPVNVKTRCAERNGVRYSFGW